MKKVYLLLCTLLVALAMQAETVTSPNGDVKVGFELSEKGEPTYTVWYKGKEVIQPSQMGLKLNMDDFTDGLKQMGSKTSTFDETWEPVWGEVKYIRNHYNELVITLEHIDLYQLDIRFRVYNDGVGFRYEPRSGKNQEFPLTYHTVIEENTEFRLTGNHTVFWIPGAYDSNEFAYETTLLSDIHALKSDGSAIGTNEIVGDKTIQSPVMLKSDDGLYIHIFEAALLDYPAMMLDVDTQNGYCLTSHLVPGTTHAVAYMQEPSTTPWRTIIVSDKATDILASKMILNLNEPCAIENTDFIKPQKYIGIWWEMHVPNHSSWDYASKRGIRLKDMDWEAVEPHGRHGATTANTKRYIDFAAKHGFDAVLVEGWNVGWEEWSGLWKEEVFDFVTPYPDFDLEVISQYAKEKGVKLIMHHETSGSVTNYERRMDEAIALMKKYGYDAVKTGYVGKIIPRGEHHDGQWMVQHYQRVVEKMAQNKIMLNAHEPVRPTGLHRTYPNLLACEAARGNEFNAWSVGNPPEHETILPFTRLMGGPMDYTPGIFQQKMDYYQAGNPCQVHTTLAKQLALYVTMYSPLQMAADLPENYERFMDAFQFIKDVAVDWDDTQVLEAEPGDYITIARKEKNSDTWFVGAITDENSRTATIDLSFLDKGTYIATIYKDGKTAHWEKNPQAYQIETKKVKNNTTLKIKLAAGGGCAIKLVKQ
jgi:hypothetical protein